MNNNFQIPIRVGLIISAFILPWWAVCVLALAALFMFDKYYEIFIIALILDTIYTTQYTSFGMYAFTLSACVLFVVTAQIKKRLIVY